MLPNVTNDTIVVLDIGGRAGRWACMSLRRAGFRVVGVAKDTHSANVFGGPLCHAVHLLPSPEQNEGMFLEALADVVRAERAAAVLPTDEEATARILATGRSRLDTAVVGPDEAQYLSLCDKVRLADTAKRAKLDTPATAFIDESGMHGGLPSPPCVVKPATTQPGAQDDPSRKAFLVHSERERDARIEELLTSCGSVVIQEHVIGTAWRVHFVSSAVGFASLPVITIGTYPREAGISTMQIVPELAPDELLTCAERLIRHVTYQGPGSVQFIERNGRFFVHDVNLRLPASVAISISGGLDMPKLAVASVLTRDEPFPPASRRREISYVWLGGEARAFRDELRAAPSRIRVVTRFGTTILTAALGPHTVLDRGLIRGRFANLLHLRLPLRNSTRSARRNL